MKKFSIFVSIGCALAFSSGCNNGAADKGASTADSSSMKDKDGFVAIFDGKTFAGWQGDTSYWRVDSGEFIGEEHPDRELKTNTFLIWRAGTPGDFEFKAEYRISGGGNSGVQYRSEEVPGVPLGLKGYQADIDGANVYTGQNYEERGRGFLAMRGQKVTLSPNVKPVVTDSLGNADSLKLSIKDSTQWNEVWIVAKGNHMQHYINRVLMSEATDNDTAARKFTGLIGLQLHVMPYMKVEYRNIRLKQD
jgi:Domain of Unknown Function (DUF1080)